MKNKHLWHLALIAYIACTLWLTVFSRKPTLMAGSEWMPLWTYHAILNEGKRYLIADIANNILMFIPVGMLAGLLSKTYAWWRVLFFGMAMSLSIELLQLHLKRGLCETDDVIHNSLGCLFGYIMAVGIMKMRNKRYGSPIS